jgi:hypothetical protein
MKYKKVDPVEKRVQALERVVRFQNRALLAELLLIAALALRVIFILKGWY